MRSRWLAFDPEERKELPVIWGLHTVAKAAASLIGICVQAIGDVVLDCSDVTDPSWSSSRRERDGWSTRSNSREWVKVWEEQGLRADIESLTNLSRAVAKLGEEGAWLPFGGRGDNWVRRGGDEPRADCASLACLSWGWFKARGKPGLVEGEIGWSRFGGPSKLVSGLLLGVSSGVGCAARRGSAGGKRFPDMKKGGSE